MIPRSIIVRRSLAAILTCWICLLTVQPASSEIINRIVAVVSGQIVTASDVEAAEFMGLAADLAQLIDRMLMLGEVRRIAPPDPPSSAIDARVARMREKFPTADAFARALSLSGLDETGVRAYAADDLRLTQYLDERFSGASQPTDQEVREAGAVTREQLVAERRQALITAWVAELRRRADVTVLDAR